MNFGLALNQDQSSSNWKIEQSYSLDIIKPKFDDYKAEAFRISGEVKALAVQDDESLNLAVMLGGSAKKIARAVEVQRKAIILEPSDFVKGVNAICKAITENLDEAERVAKQKIAQHQAKIELERRKQEEAARKAAEELQEKLRKEAEELNRKAREEAARKAEEETRARLAREAVDREKQGKESAKQAEERAKREAEEIEEAKKRAEAEATRHAIEAPTVVAQVFEKSETVTRTETGASAFSKKPWKYEVTNLADVPDDYTTRIINDQSVKDAIKQGIREIKGIRIYQDNQINFRS